MLPDFIIIGAQKSATTFVHKCLEEHPEVFMPPKETPFFENPFYFQSDINQFQQLFENVSKEKIIGIKRPNYLAKPECPERIHKHLPNAKLIVILRSPVERSISAYFHQMKFGQIPIKSVEKGMKKVIDDEYKKSYPRSKEIIDFGFYYQHLMRYLKYFAKSQIFVLLYNDIKLNPLDSIKQIYGFLGINDKYIPKALNSRPQVGVYSLTRLRILNIRNRLIYTYSNNNSRVSGKPAITFLERLITRLISLLDRRFFSRIYRNSKPKLSVNLTKRLFEIYKADVNRLEDLLDRKLIHWKLYSRILESN